MGKYAIMVKGIVRYEGQYMLVKRWYDDRIENPYQWEFVDGQIEFGEEPDKAVVRLIKERRNCMITALCQKSSSGIILQTASC